MGLATSLTTHTDNINELIVIIFPVGTMVSEKAAITIGTE
jgi:hypothetical protein